MEESNKVSLTRLAMGAIEERLDLEVAKVIDNIQDLNTKAGKKRTLTLVAEFLPAESRNHINMNTIVKLKLESASPIQTSLAVYTDRNTGEIAVVELVPNVPGQLNMDGGEQEPPAQLKLVR